jgi:hypothetical protein
MPIHPSFADWYRSAALTPPEALLDKRWAGVEDSVKQPSAALLLSLAKLFTLSIAAESAVPAGFRDTFRAHDEAFPSRNNLQELRVLAGAILRLVIEQNQPLSPLAALALVCGSFGPREAALPERQHLDAAQRYIVDYSTTTRESVAPAQMKIPSFTKAKFGETLQQNFFAVNQTPNMYEPLLNTLTEIASGFSSALKQAQKAVEQLTHTANARQEEVAILWWLQTHFSKDLQRPFSEIGYVTGTLVFPMELADLTVFVPGSEAGIAILVHALQLAGAPSSSETVTIAQATNSAPREWREKVCAEHKFDTSGLLTPLLIAIHKSLETDGRDDWLPVYRKTCDIPVDRPFTLIQLSLQLFHERMLLRALAETKS